MRWRRWLFDREPPTAERPRKRGRETLRSRSLHDDHGSVLRFVTPRLLRRRSLAAASIREVVFGAEDGLVQNMTLIAGMVGAQLSARVIVIAAGINAIAGVLSMSMGTYLSSKAERDVVDAGVADHPTTRDPSRDAMVMAGAYAVGALVPIMPFLVPVLPRTSALIGAVVLTAAALFGLGWLTAVLSRQPRLRSGLEMLLLATGAGLAGYLIGLGARVLFSVDF